MVRRPEPQGTPQVKGILEFPEILTFTNRLICVSTFLYLMNAQLVYRLQGFFSLIMNRLNIG
jgi:hypothetical protein